MRRSLHIFSIVFFVITAILIWQMGYVDREDIQEYEALLQSSSQKRDESLPFFSKQFRKNVVKEVWWGQNNPLYIRIASETSELAAARNKGKYEAIEKLSNVKCVFQEKLYYLDKEGKMRQKEDDVETLKTLLPVQEIRYFEAAKGVCNYTNSDFVGDDVIMKKYRVKGHIAPIFSLPNLTPLSQGMGKRLFLNLKKEGGINVNMESMQTTFNPKDGI